MAKKPISLGKTFSAFAEKMLGGGKPAAKKATAPAAKKSTPAKKTHPKNLPLKKPFPKSLLRKNWWRKNPLRKWWLKKQ